jgi:Flp pilus assembly pilin Flp
MLSRLKNLLLRVHHDDRGAMSAEMILIIALIAIPILVLLAIFRTKIIGWFNTQNQNLDQQNPG